MSSHAEVWTIGVEEEYQIVNPYTRALCADAEQLLALTQATTDLTVSAELQCSQIEISTPICSTLAEVRSALLYARRKLIATAATMQRGIAAAGTHPFSHWQTQKLTPSQRYQTMEQTYQQLTREQVIFGYHVHIGCEDREYALQIVNRARIWLAPLLALSSNSPFWLGKDTGYASFRTEVWCRWPMAGPPGYFPTFADYTELVRTLIATGSIQDTSHIYWDIRLSERFPTIEFRVMDACMTIDEAVMQAGLIRALVQTCYDQAKEHIPFPHPSIELLRNAHWRAARYGLDHDLIDIQAGHAVPAHTLIDRFLKLLRPTLEANGDWTEISQLVNKAFINGNGATRQREIYQQTGKIEDVVDFILAETAGFN